MGLACTCGIGVAGDSISGLKERGLPVLVHRKKDSPGIGTLPREQRRATDDLWICRRYKIYICIARGWDGKHTAFCIVVRLVTIAIREEMLRAYGAGRSDNTGRRPDYHSTEEAQPAIGSLHHGHHVSFMREVARVVAASPSL